MHNAVIEGMIEVREKLRTQKRFHEIRLDAIEQDRQLHFFLEPDEIKQIAGMIREKIEHLSVSIAELQSEISEEATRNGEVW